MGKILNISISLLMFVLISCDFGSSPDIQYDLKAGSEEAIIKNNQIIDKPAVFVFQLESKNSDELLYDTEEKGIDRFSFNVLKTDNYHFKLNTGVDSVSIKIYNSGGELLSLLDTPGTTDTVRMSKGIYSCTIENLKTENKIRRIFYLPDYGIISRELDYNNDRVAKYSIFAESNCQDCNFQNILLTNYDFSNGDYTNSSFEKAKLSNSNFTNTELRNVNFLDVVADSTDFSGSNFENVNDLRHGSYINSKFDKVIITNANAKFSNFYSATFDSSLVNNSSFEETDLFNASFINSDLEKVNFSNSILSFADFIGTKIFDVNFCNSDLEGVIFKDIDTNDTNSCLPDSLIN